MVCVAHLKSDNGGAIVYSITKYDMLGNITERTEHNETIAAPDSLREYQSIVEQLDAEEWDLRDSTNPAESLKDRQDFWYA